MTEPADAVPRFAALLSPPGQELLAELGREVDRHGATLRLGSGLRARYPVDLVVDALAQHELRLLARAKFSRAMDMFFTRPGLEQASSEVSARHRSARFEGAGLVADLCCGIGGDLVDAEVYGVAGGVTTVAADVRDIALDRAGGLFIDPARRRGGRRLRAGYSEPPLAWCLGLARQVSRVGVKAAPGLARDAVPPGWELEFIALGR